MIFPLPPVWFGDPRDEKVVRRIDRYEDSKHNRMLIGLHVASDYSRLSGALLVVSGHGKYLRALTWKSIELELPAPLQDSLLAIQNAETHDLLQLRAAQSELAVQQAILVQKLKETAGKYVDRILAVSLTEPGLWRQDFDGRQIYFPMSLPAQLAETTGLNVLDSFPEEDIESGGSGTQLEALPLWLLLADRDDRAATESRVVVLVEESAQIVFLPGSDGAESELPDILRAGLNGFDLVHRLQQQYDGASSDTLDDRQHLQRMVGGRANEALLAKWRAIPKNEINSSTMWEAVSSLSGSTSFEDILRSIVVFSSEEVVAKISQFDRSLPLGKISISGEGAYSTLLLTELTNRFRTSSSTSPFLGSVDVDSIGGAGGIQAVLAGMLGFLLIDQTPASLPWITGCQTPRILGRVTKGRPVAWKQLLVEMADYQPPAMKLREAI